MIGEEGSSVKRRVRQSEISNATKFYEMQEDRSGVHTHLHLTFPNVMWSALSAVLCARSEVSSV